MPDDGLLHSADNNAVTLPKTWQWIWVKALAKLLKNETA